MSNLSADIKQIFKLSFGITVVITVGNILRTDDGLGPFIGSRVKSREDLKVINAKNRPENIIDEVISYKPSRIIIIDAADFEGKPGQIKLIDKECISKTTLSTHMIPLPVITSILENDTGASVFFIGVQPKNVILGEHLSFEVEESAWEIIKLIEEGYKDA